jgi:hypothetical protein
MKRVQDLVGILMFLGVSLLAQTRQGPADREYYPLSEGNYWKYGVYNERSKWTGSVTWRVTRAKKMQGGLMYQVWPTPMQADDEAVELFVSSDGIVDAWTMTPIIAFPARIGDQWFDRGVSPPCKFQVLSVGRPCRGRFYASDDCLVIEDVDEAARLRTVTQYARHIGPVKYEFYRPGASKAARPVQTVEIVSYHINRGAGNKKR